MRSILKEPLVHFLLIGAGLFLLFGMRGNPTSLPGGQPGPQSTRIVVNQGDIDQLTATFVRTWQRAPTEAETRSLIDNLVRDEIYYREALAIGLDRDDTTIRRRMRQKMEFIFEDITAQVEPKDEELVAFMKKHPDKYLVDPQISFRQVYVNVDKRGTSAEADAQNILVQLNRGADPNSAGDVFLLEPDTRLLPVSEIRREFGGEFTRSLTELNPGKWEGPVRSGYGLHLVFVRERIGGRVPELDEVREAVSREWKLERQNELKDAAYAKIRERYTVIVEKPKADTIPSVARQGGGA